MKRVLVTGSTGFIGNYVVRELLRNHCEVIASSLNIDKAKELDWYKKVQYKQFNLGSFNSAVNYYEFFNYPDVIIHLAWEGLPNYKDAFHYEINLPRHFNLLKNLISYGLKDITISGTCFEYGMREGCLNERMPSAPDNFYATAKNELRRALEAFQQESNFTMKWIRLFYMYGAGQNPKSLISQLDTAIQKGDSVFKMSGGEQVRDYLPVEKVAEYIVKTALQNEVTGIVNCCSGEPISVKQLVKDYLHKKNASIQLKLGYYPYPDYEPMAFWGDDSKLKSLLQS